MTALPFKFKRHLSTAASNPWLAEGEEIKELDTGKAKIGPAGGAYWNDIDYTPIPVTVGDAPTSPVVPAGVMRVYAEDDALVFVWGE